MAAVTILQWWFFPEFHSLFFFVRPILKAALKLHDHFSLASHHPGLHIFPTSLTFSVSTHHLTHLGALKEEGPWWNVAWRGSFCPIQPIASAPASEAEQMSLCCGSNGWCVGEEVRRSSVWNQLRKSQASMQDKRHMREEVGTIHIRGTYTNGLFNFARFFFLFSIQGCVICNKTTYSWLWKLPMNMMWQWPSYR